MSVMTKLRTSTSGLYYGWVITGTFFFLMAASWGIAQGTFGVFVTPLTEDMGWSRTAVSAAFSILSIVNFVVGIFWGWMSDRWGIRVMIAASGALMGLGMFLTSKADSLWQLYLFYGLIAGAGLGGVSGPLAAVAVRWFQRRRGLAIGIGYAGSGAGNAGMPVLANHFISLKGWQFGFQGLSFIVWGMFLAGALLLKEPQARPSRAVPATASISPATARRERGVYSARSSQGLPAGDLAVPLPTALRSRAFWLLVAMMATASLILTMVLVHLVPRAVDKGIPSSTAVTLLTVTGILTMVGTLAGGVLGDRLGHRRVFAISLLLIGLTLLWLTFATSLWMFYTFAVFFGLINGAWYPQVAAITPRIFGTRHMGAIYGTLLLGSGVGGVIGPILGGSIFDATGSYQIAFILGAGIAVLSGALALVLRDEPYDRRRRRRLPPRP